MPPSLPHLQHIDTAEQYGNEEAVGKGLAKALSASTAQREDLFIASKLWNNHHARGAVRKALVDSMHRLQLDYLDLWLIHWPYTGKSGPRIDPPLEETWEAMEQCAEEGLVRSIGVSNFSPSKVQDVLRVAKRPIDVNQVEVHPHFRNESLRQWCSKQGIHVSAYGPLSSPGTMDSMSKAVPNLMKDPKVKAVAHKLRKTPSQVLLRWGLDNGSSVIPKSTNPEHIKANMGALGWTLPREDLDMLSQLGYQRKYFDGAGFTSQRGPFTSYAELWDEQPPKDQ